MSEEAHSRCLAATRATLAAQRREEEEEFTVVGRGGAGGPKGVTLGDCLVGAGPRRSRQQRKPLPLGTPAVAKWQPGLRVLQREAALVAAVTRSPVGGVVEAVVGSGAEESVAPPGVFAAAVVPSKMSRAGLRYRAANGSRIKNVGQQRVGFTTSKATTR